MSNHLSSTQKKNLNSHKRAELMEERIFRERAAMEPIPPFPGPYPGPYGKSPPVGGGVATRPGSCSSTASALLQLNSDGGPWRESSVAGSVASGGASPPPQKRHFSRRPEKPPSPMSMFTGYVPRPDTGSVSAPLPRLSSSVLPGDVGPGGGAQLPPSPPSTLGRSGSPNPFGKRSTHLSASCVLPLGFGPTCMGGVSNAALPRAQGSVQLPPVALDPHNSVTSITSSSTSNGGTAVAAPSPPAGARSGGVARPGGAGSLAHTLPRRKSVDAAWYLAQAKKDGTGGGDGGGEVDMDFAFNSLPELSHVTTLPELAHRGSLTLPNLVSPKTQTGFLERPARVQRTSNSGTSDVHALDGSPITMTTPRKSQAATTPGRNTFDRTAFHPREDDVMHIATMMGIVHKEQVNVAPNALGMAAGVPAASSNGGGVSTSIPVAIGGTGSPARAGSRLAASSVSASPMAGGSAAAGAASAASIPEGGKGGTISPLGVQLSVLLRLLEQAASPDKGDPDHSTAEVVRQHVGPSTQQYRCKYIDTVNVKMTGAPDVYIMHSWHSPFSATMRAVQQYFVTLCKKRPDEVFVWMDIVCVNQHVALKESDLGALGEVLKAAPQALLVLDQEGDCLSRTWIHFELFKWAASATAATAANSNAATSIDKLVVLPSSWDWVPLSHPFLLMDAEAGRTSDPGHKGMLLGQMVRAGANLGLLTQQLKGMLVTGARYEMNKAELHSNLTPRRFITAANSYALMLFQTGRLSEAEETMMSVKAFINKQSSIKEISVADEASCLLHLAMVKREKVQLSDAEVLLQIVCSLLKDKPSEMYVRGASMLVDVQCDLKMYTKAEMLCRKLMELSERQHGPNNASLVHRMLQLASIAIAQHIYEEAEIHADAAAHLAAKLHGPDSLDSASCYYMLAICVHANAERRDKAVVLLEHANNIRERLLGPDHPLTLQVKGTQAQFLSQAGNLQDAEVLMEKVYKSRSRIFGIEYHETMDAFCQLSDMYLLSDRMDDALVIEKQMLEVGRDMLKRNKIDRFRTLRLISNHLVGKDHLMEKASMFLAKAFVAYREKLGIDAELTSATRVQLLGIIAETRDIAAQALDEGEIFNRQDKFQMAELMFQQALSLSKLVNPESQHKELARSLADALFGQGKATEAKNVLRTAGLVKQGMKAAIPASYLRWLNRRVEKYMDGAPPRGEGIELEEEWEAEEGEGDEQQGQRDHWADD